MPDPSVVAPQRTCRSMVLVHGAWQGSWAFDAWRPRLEARGWTVHAVDLPGNGWPPDPHGHADLDSYTAHVVSALDRLDTPAVVVGHSGGGITASQVAEAAPERVAALVYLAGIMLPSGATFGDVLARCRGEHPGHDVDGIAPHLTWNADRSESSVTIDGALSTFVHDCPPDAARAAAALLRPQQESGRRLRNRLTAERHGRVPRVYVECTQDRSLPLVLQRTMQALSPGAVRLSLDCGHVPQLAQPQALTDAVCAALAALHLGPDTVARAVSEPA